MAEPLPLHDFGAPNGTEQYLIESLNRCRANPGAEAQYFRDCMDPAKRAPHELDWDLRDTVAYFGVNMSQMQAQIAALPAAPPLAPNAALMRMARAHTQWMFDTRQEEHSDLLALARAHGYQPTTLAENIYAYGLSLFYSHAGFEIDWGGPKFGMQDPPLHRQNNHSSSFREVGATALFGTNGTGASMVGPVLGTVHFGSASRTGAFVTGVAFYDVNGNGLYDPEEGIGGLRVEVSGASWAAMTAPGGGFAVPVPLEDATRTVTLSGPGVSETRQVTIAGGRNVRVEFRPAWQAPQVSVGNVLLGTPARVSWPVVPGASAHGWVKAAKISARPEPCDSAAGVTSFTSRNASGGPLYPLVQTAVKVAGGAFHLAHPVLETQWIMLNARYLCGPASVLTFQSRLAAANQRQVARVQASTDDGATWRDVVVPGQMPQVGAGTPGQSAFVSKTLPLDRFAGRIIRLRFAYTLGGTEGLVVTTSSSSGWFIDNISFTETWQLQDEILGQPAADPQFTLTTSSTDPLVVAARPFISGRFWSFGPALEVRASAAPQGYMGWAMQAESQCGLPPGSVADFPLHDCSGNGVPNLLKYALGLDPRSSTQEGVPVPVRRGDEVVMSFVRDLSKSDLTLVVEGSTDLETWHAAGASGTPFPLQERLLRQEGALEFCEAAVPVGGSPVWLRLRATR